jgi:hypothetical protein
MPELSPKRSLAKKDYKVNEISAMQSQASIQMLTDS